MRVEPVRRNLVYFLATVVTVGIFFTHDMLANHAHALHTNKKHFHVDQNFLSSKKLQDQEISIHGKYTLKELSSKIKQLKEEHSKARPHSKSAPRGPKEKEAVERASDAAVVKTPSEPKTGTAKDLEDHRKSNPTFAKKDPFEEKCVTNSLEQRLERRFKDNYVSSREVHPYRSNFKVPKYWPLHMRGNNICKHIKWQVVGQVNNKVMKIFPATDLLKEKVRRGRYGTCAVVGNGGGSLLKEYGKHIDDHEIVIRFNGGPTVGFEKHVGSRTSFRIDNSEHFMSHEKHTNETVLQHITNSKNFKQLFKIADRDALKDRLSNLHIIDPFFQYYVLNLHNDGAPSNGFYGIAFANLICNQITLFGYQKEWKHQKIPYHYYDKVEPNANQYGRDTREVQRFNDLLDAMNAVARRNLEWQNWSKDAEWPTEKVILADEYLEMVSSKFLEETERARPQGETEIVEGGDQGERATSGEDENAADADEEEEQEEQEEEEENEEEALGSQQQEGIAASSDDDEEEESEE